MAPVARKQSSEPGGAAPSVSAGEIDWLSACRRMVAAQRELFAEERGIAARTVYVGIGEGGDRTLAIDRRCEDIVFAELERLHAEGHQFTAISEERGEVAFGDPGSPVSVIVDPLDGSLNARRMLPSHSLSIAVASGPTMADVELGLRVRLRRRRGVLRRPRRGGDARRQGAARRGARLRPRGGGDRVGQARANAARCSRRSPARHTGSAPSARSRSPSATWPGAASTAC